MLQQILSQLGFKYANVPFRISDLLALLSILVFLRIFHLIRIYRNRPRSIIISSKPYSVGRWLKNLDFLFNGPTLITEAYRNQGGNKSSFAIPSLAEYQVLACSKDDIQELCNSSPEVLSFHAAMSDRMQHKYTMYGFEYGEVDPHDSVPTRAIKVLFRMNLPRLRPLIERKVRDVFDLELNKGSKLEGWTSISAFKFSKAVVKRVNAYLVLGEQLANQPECVKAAIRYAEDAVMAAEISRQVPSIFTPLIASGYMRWSGAMQKLATFITRVMEERLCPDASNSSPKETYMDCIQWTIESSYTPAQRAIPRMVAQVIGIYLASAHQMSMSLVYILYALCDHPEYLSPLREEMTKQLGTNSKDPFKEMHLLDSFLLETARLYVPDALTVQRKVMKPITLPSGAYIPPGNLIAAPQQVLALDPDKYPNPNQFDGRRFMPKHDPKGGTEAVSKFTDVSYSHLYWGSPRRACPGRWYVSATLKQIVVHAVMNYEFRLQDQKEERFFIWTTALVPRSTTRILIRKRELP